MSLPTPSFHVSWTKKVFRKLVDTEGRVFEPLDLMIEKDMPIGESYARSESFEILPFGPPCATWGRWAKISPLSTRMWITLEQKYPFHKP